MEIVKTHLDRKFLKISSNKFLLLKNSLHTVKFYTLLILLFSGKTVFAQPGILLQPSNFPTTCQPNAPTTFTHTQLYTVNKGSCGNSGTFTFEWEYFNGSSWTKVSNNLPLGFTYSVTSSNFGNGANVQGTSGLSISLSSIAAIGTFQFRSVATYSACPTNRQTSNPITFTVNPKPAPTFTSQAGSSGCVNSDYTYTSEAGQAGYAWTVPGVENTDYRVVSGSLSSNTVTLKWLTTGSKTVAINYTNSNGCTAQNPTTSIATVIGIPPIPTFTTQAGTTTCSDTDVTYTTQPGFSNYAWAFTGTANVDYSIITGGTSTSNTVTLKWLSSGPRTVIVNYSNNDNCTGSNPASSSTTVNARPVPSFTTSPGTTTCTDANVTYTTLSGQTDYVWNVPGTPGVDYAILAGGIGPTNNTVTLQWITAGTKTVTINYSNAGGCNAVASGTSVTEVVSVAIPVITADGPLTFCVGESVVLTSSSATNYQWYNDGTIIPGATAQSYTASSAATYTVKVLNATGCEATSSGSIVIENALPDIAISAQASGLCFSAGSQISQLDYSGTNNSPVTYSIVWSAAASSAGFVDVSNASLPLNSISIQLPAGASGNTTFTGALTVQNANGCISTSKPFSVSITSAPDVNSFSLSAASGCAGTGAVISVSSTSIANGTYTVTYDLSGANMSTGNTAVMVFNNGVGTFQADAANAGSTNIMVTQVALVGCSTPVNTNNTASFIVNPLPVVASITGPGGVCVSSTVTLANNTPGGVWSSSEPSVATVASDGIVSGLAAGTVVITYTTPPDAITGCTNSSNHNFSVYALPVIESITGPTALCVNTTTKLDNLTPGGSWSSSNEAIATIDNSGLVTAVSLGTVTIIYTTATNAEGCTNSASVTVSIDPVPVVFAGDDSEVCESESPTAITLGGATLGGSATSATWFIEAGGGTLSNPGPTANPESVTYTPAANFSGTVTLSLTSNSTNSCTPAIDIRTIEVTEKSLIVAGEPLNACESISPVAFTLSGASISGGATTGAWSIKSGGGVLSSTSPTSDPSSITYTPPANFSGIITLTLTSDASGTCLPASADRVINITPPPTAIAGTAIVTCESGSAINITTGSSATDFTSINWESSGTGTFTNNFSLTEATYTPSIADAQAGSVTITLKANGGACTDATSSKILSITKAATANAGSIIAVCEGAGAVNITDGATAENYITVLWSTDGTGTISNPGSLTLATYTPGNGETGIVTLTLTASGNTPCTDAISTKSFTINPNASIALTSALSTQSQVLCINTAITNITYAIGGGGTNASFSGLPGGVTGNFAGGVVTISGTPTAPGLFSYTITTTGTCVQATATGTLNVSPVTAGGTLSPALATGCTGSITGTVTLSGHTGDIIRWESSVNGGTTWSNIANTSDTQTYNGLTQTTIYRALLQSGTCINSYSSLSVISIVTSQNPTSLASPGAICVGQTSVLTSTTGYPTSGIADSVGDFRDANPAGWRRDGQSTGSFLPANRDNASSGPWGETNGPKTFSGIEYDGAGGKFAIVDGNLTSLLETPVFSLIGQTSVNFDFSHAYNLLLGATATIEISTDGGLTYTSVNILAQYSGAASFGITGSTGQVQPASISLAKYIGLSNLRIRFRYEGGSTNSSWALDNVKVPAILPITYLWTDTSSPSTLVTDPTGASVTVNPTVTTTYTLTTFVNGCPAGTSTVTVTVNPLPTISPAAATGGAVSTCYSVTSQNVPIPYSATNIPLPATYTITWNGAAIAAGFVNITASLTQTSISLAVPGGALVGTYSGILRVNNANGCASPEAPFSLIIRPLPIISVPVPPLICAGADVVLTASGAATYTWSPALGLSATSGTSVNASPNVTTTYTVTGTDEFGCVSSTTVTVSVTTGYVWTGLGTNNLWTNDANWTVCGEPPYGASVTIPQVDNGNFPKMDIDFASNDFDLQGDATVNINGMLFQLGTSTGSVITNSGSFIGSETSKLVIYGSVGLPLKFDQSVLGSTNALLSLSLNMGGTLTLDNPLWVVGDVLPNSGILASEGNLTMVSTANTSSNISAIGAGADVSGIVNVQSFITGGSLTLRGFRSMSSPINDSGLGEKTFQQLKKSLIITGPGGVANGFDQGGWAQPYAETISFYDESIGAGLPSFVPLAKLDQSSPAGKGFYLFFRGSRLNYDPATSNKVNQPYVAPESVTVTYSGPINKGDVSFTLRNSNNVNDSGNGYNLVGNPYPSSIDWDAITKSAGILNSVIIYKQGGTQASYTKDVNGVVVVTNGGGTTIQPGQGFYARTSTDGATIKFTENSKSSNYPARFLVAPEERVMSLPVESHIKSAKPSIVKLNLNNSANTDETAIVFSAGASAEADYEDVTYMSGSTVNLASVSSDNKALAINFHPELLQATEVRLAVNAVQSGALKLNFTEFSGFGEFQIFLKDALSPDILQNVQLYPEYNFSVDRTKFNTFGLNRFTLVFKPVVYKRLALQNFSLRKQSGDVELTWMPANLSAIRHFEVQHSLDGKAFTTLGTMNVSSATKYSFVDKEPLTGTNFYRIKAIELNSELALSEVKSVEFSDSQLLAKRNSIQIFPNPSTDKVEIDLNVKEKITADVKIYDVSGSTVLSRTVKDVDLISLDVSSLQPGIYIVEVINTIENIVIGRSRLIKIN